ncbi:uncharacterized protein [Nicotiana tomentosiformis]|uniref:uncharacterized protein n=1 Tax=Nicotiana tomentosiformis TaxID=4098 RepID=UPI00388CCF0C
MEKAAPEATPPSTTQTVDPAKGGVACEFGSTSSHPNISKRLDLTSPVLVGSVTATLTVPANGTVNMLKPAQNQVNSSEKSAKAEVVRASEAEPKSPWATLFQKNIFVTNGMSLSYIPPQIIDGQHMVQLDKSEIEAEENKWRCVLIAYILGDGPRYNAMKRYINLHWSHVAEPDLFYHDEGYYIIRFQTIEDAQFPTVIPLCVKFPKLPISCWGVGSLSRIACVIGKTIFVDECTTKQTRVSFARTLIEVNVTIELPIAVMVMDPTEKKFMQVVTYDWKLAYCDKCLVVGHKYSNQARPMMQQSIHPKKVWSNKPLNTSSSETQQQVITNLEAEVHRRATQIPEPKESNTQQNLVPVAEKQDDKGNAVQSPELNLINFPLLSPIPMRNRYKQNEVREYIRRNKIKLVDFVETKVKEGNAQRISKAIVPGWNVLTNYKDAKNGRIWLLCDTNHLIVTSLKDDAQMIHCQVKSRRGDIDCLLTVVYGYNGIEQRRSLWDNLQLLSVSIIVPWLIAGDFNAVLYPKDRLSCNPVNCSEIQEFATCLQQTTLIELPWKDDYYTWINKQPGVDRVISRLDRVFGNYEWMMSWGHVETNYGLPQISYHAPMLLTLSYSTWTGKITDQEIVESLKAIGDNKAPGIDGFYTVFFKNAWGIINIQITEAIKEFFSTGKIYWAINFSTITLVPKVTKPATIKEYRPIACCSVLYKMISKILASRLQKVMPTIICEAQAGFILGRKIADNGLRQGDPISPFLFAIVMEYLSRSLNELKKDPSFQHHPGCRKLDITHMSFADDLLLFAKGNLSLVTTIYKYFSQFSEASGLHANLGKSSVYFGGVKQDVKKRILDHLGFEQDSLPFKYLGIPLSTKKIALIQWQPLIEKITAKISSWTTKKLSYDGRVQLVQSVIFGIQAYRAQLFILPAKVLKMIEALCRRYIWLGTNTITKKALVTWEKICTPKSAGGLNLINLPLWNKAGIAKTF